MSETNIESLRRELDHVNEQLKVEHAMMLNWKARALTAEQQLARTKKAPRGTSPDNAPLNPRDTGTAGGWGDLPMAAAVDDDR